MHGDYDIWDIDVLRVRVFHFAPDNSPKTLAAALRRLNLHKTQTDNDMALIEIVLACKIHLTKGLELKIRNREIKQLIRNFSIYLKRRRGETYKSIGASAGVSGSRAMEICRRIDRDIQKYADPGIQTSNMALCLRATLDELIPDTQPDSDMLFLRRFVSRYGPTYLQK